MLGAAATAPYRAPPRTPAPGAELRAAPHRSRAAWLAAAAPVSRRPGTTCATRLVSQRASRAARRVRPLALARSLQRCRA